MGIESLKRKNDTKEIVLDAEAGVSVVGRRYAGDLFNQRAAAVSFKSQIEMRAAIKKEDYAEQIRIKTLNGLQATCLGDNPFIVELKDETGFSVSGQDLVDLLVSSEYSHLIGQIDDALDPSSKEFSLSKEECIAEGKRLRSISGGGGKPTEAKA